MPLVPVTQYTLTFDTTTGQDIKWELDIRRTYDDADGLPPWINDPVIPLVGTGNPIEIEWERDYDVYKPIIGSKATVNLLVQNAGQYADFNQAGPYEYQVRLRYTDENDAMQDYWRGYMTPLDGSESVGTFPFPISFTATDGLGLLEEATADVPTSIDDVNVIDAVTEALYQTGLNLDVYLDSGIQVGDGGTPVVYSEALRQVTIDPDWVYNEERTERLTRKEQIEGILSAFNCTIKQSNGKWYITNASTYGGLNDTVTFEVYNVVTTVYVKNATDVTEQVRYTIDGSNTQSLVPANQDLVLNNRRPNGSVECKPKGFYSEDVQNGGFEVVNDDATSSPVGWSAGPTEGPLMTSDTIRQAGERSIYTNHNTFELDTVNDTWFTNTTGIDVNGSGTFEVSFDMLAELLITSGSEGVRNAKLSYQVIFVPDNPMTLGGLSLFNPSNLFTVPNITANAYFYNPEREEWIGSSSMDTRYGFDLNVIEAEGDDVGEWLRASVMMPKVRVWDYTLNDFGETTVGAGKLFVRFYFPRGNRPQGNGKGQNRGNGNDRMNVYVDNVSAKNMFSNDVTDPTFERIQTNYTSTYTYEPGIASSTSPALVQTVNQSDFIRTGNGLDIILNKSLEEIGTQLKLNDFRNNFKYYEGSLVNLTTSPLAPHHKVYVNWNNYSETATCIINGGRFKVKDNQFEVAMYVPDQSSDIAPGDGTITNGVPGPGFYEQNVDLIPMPFPGISTKRVYSLNVVVVTTDEADNIVPDGLVPVQQSYQWTGSPGDQRQIEIALEPITDMRALSGSTAPDSTDTPLPSYLTNVVYTLVGTNLRVNATLTIPEDSEFETLHILGNIGVFTPEVTPAIVTQEILFNRPIDSNIISPTGSTVTVDGVNYIQSKIPVSGVQGDYKRITYQIEALDGRVMTNVQETHPSGSLGVGVVTGNELPVATITFDYLVPGGTTPVSVLIGADTNPGPGTGITIITKTLTITNDTANTTVEDGLSIEYKGVAGDERRDNITVNPTNDRYIQALSTSSVSGDITVGTPYSSGEDWEIPIIVDIVDNTTQPSFTIGGTVPLEPYSITFNVNNLGLNNAQISMDSVQHRITFDDGDITTPGTSFPRAGEELLVTIEPIGNYVFTSTSDIAIDINEAAATVTVDGVTNVRQLPEIQFSPGTVTLQADGSLVFPITGTFPTIAQGGGQYVLDVNIISSTTSNGGNGGGPTLKPATIGPDPDNPLTYIRSLTSGISSAGGVATFEVVANGAWNANITIANQDTGDQSNDTGSFDVNVGPATLPSALNIKGSYSPTFGGEGTHLITLETGEEPMYLRPGGPEPGELATTYFTTNGVTYVLYIYARQANGDDGPSPLIGDNVRQSQEFGGRTYEVPAGWDGTETSLIAASQVKDTWTFYI